MHDANPKIDGHVHIWGGRKLIDFLSMYPDLAKGYSELITPGHILNKIYDSLSSNNAEIENVIRYLVVTQFEEQQYTKPEQAGSESDSRPSIHDVFVDLPYRYAVRDKAGHQITRASYAFNDKLRASARVINFDDLSAGGDAWLGWDRLPQRARVWFVKGGPGQGKSTLIQ